MTAPAEGWVITLDGPAGSGKSTTARGVARALDFVYLDTGALYRAITVLALRTNSTENGDALAELASGSNLEVRRQGETQQVLCRGEDLTPLLRSTNVEAHVSAISARPEVRQAMLGLQRAQRRPPGLVAEGRDLGTVVFPEAHLKVYLVADLDVRAQRRALEREGRGEATSVAREQEALAARDRFDSTRKVAPLVEPAGSFVVDTSRLSVAGQIQRVLELFRAVAV